MGEFIASRLSLGQAHTAAARLLREARIAAPELDARLLLCHATGLSHEAYVAALNDALAPDAAARFGAFVERRLAGEPVSRIIGIREFYGRSFRIDASTLDPRPDTETLIEAALGFVGPRGAAQHPRPRHGERLHPRDAVGRAAAGERRRRRCQPWRRLSWRGPMPRVLGVGDRAAFLASDWLEAVEGSFDLVVANPPYLSAADMAALSPEVRDHDPAPALDGGPDGLSAYRRIVPGLRKALRPGGFALFEIGPDQAQAVARLLADAGLDGGEFSTSGAILPGARGWSERG